MTDNPGDVIIRRARTEDAVSLGDLGALLVEEHHTFDALRFIAPTAETPRRYGAFLVSQLDAPHTLILVAESAGRVIGYGYAALQGFDYMALRGPAAVLQDLIIEPESRGRGVGGRLLAAILEEMRDRGAPRIVLSTAWRNEGAQRLFERTGFRKTMVEMTLELTDASNQGAEGTKKE